MKYEWKCTSCGSTGGTDIRAEEGVYRGADIVLALHRAVAPDCKGGADTIRVTATGASYTVPQRGKKKAQASRA